MWPPRSWSTQRPRHGAPTRHGASGSAEAVAAATREAAPAEDRRRAGADPPAQRALSTQGRATAGSESRAAGGAAAVPTTPKATGARRGRAAHAGHAAARAGGPRVPGATASKLSGRGGPVARARTRYPRLRERSHAARTEPRRAAGRERRARPDARRRGGDRARVARAYVAQPADHPRAPGDEPARSCWSNQGPAVRRRRPRVPTGACRTHHAVEGAGDEPAAERGRSAQPGARAPGAALPPDDVP